MDSLQWIDSSALAVERKLGEVTRCSLILTIIVIIIVIINIILVIAPLDHQHWEMIGASSTWKTAFSIISFSRLAEVQKRDNERLQRSMLEWISVTGWHIWMSDANICLKYLNKNLFWVKQQISEQSTFEVRKNCITFGIHSWGWLRLMSCETIRVSSMHASKLIYVGQCWSKKWNYLCSFFQNGSLNTYHLWGQ